MKINIRRFSRYFFEFTIVFLSVSLSFLVDEWRDNTKNKDKVNDLFIRLKNELITKSKHTRKYVDFFRDIDRANSKICDNFLKRTLSPDSLVALIFYANTKMVFDPRINSWESILSSGNIDLIDKQLVDSMFMLRRSYEAIALSVDDINENALNRLDLVMQTIDGEALAIAAHNFIEQDTLRPKKKWDTTEFFRTAVTFDYFLNTDDKYKQILNLYESEHKASEETLLKMLDERIKNP